MGAVLHVDFELLLFEAGLQVFGFHGVGGLGDQALLVAHLSGHPPASIGFVLLRALI